ncbi:MAG TPA: prephenate dehydrogenase/arogenate dehydrogenase family protein [Candidatus Methylacidiphilales bacterium]|nr:prephenate dehydrogenase/arogenate dehydrogenase family protein [Candidatus Methylacidiphilales bacterium]
MNFGTVAILGPGLIGGSLALALAERGLAKRLMIYARSPRALDEIRLAGVDAELTQNPSEAVREADIVILCVPIEAMAALVAEFRDALKPNALVTDVGSVKGSVDRELAPLLDGRALWIGSHPMAGSEQAGFSAARANLFVNAAVIITPTSDTRPEATERAEKFWSQLGGRVLIHDPGWHDVAIAQVSHIPHLVAALLISNVTEKNLTTAGSGLRDTTRVASGSPELWTEIIWANREAIRIAIYPLMLEMGKVHEALRHENKTLLREALQDAHDHRAKLLKI